MNYSLPTSETVVSDFESCNFSLNFKNVFIFSMVIKVTAFEMPKGDFRLQLCLLYLLYLFDEMFDTDSMIEKLSVQ